MPCYSAPPTTRELNSMGYLDDKQFEAVLCGILTLHTDILDGLDWQKIGVDEQIVRGWWAKHQERDRKRKEYQRMEKEKQDAKERDTYERLKAKFDRDEGSTE